MRILIIRFKQIGDVLLTSTLCSSLKKSFPDARIDYLMYAASAPLFENHPAIDNVFVVGQRERRNPLRYLKLIWSLAGNRYDIIIDASSTAKSELISRLSPRAKYRIGRYKKGRGRFYTHRFSKNNQDKIEERLAMLQPLINDGLPIEFDKQMLIQLTAQERSSALALFEENGVDLSQPVFAFSVSSKFDWRMWNLGSMKQVAEHCLKQYHAQIVLLTGMPHEAEIIDQFRQSLAGYDKVFNTIEAPGLRALAAVLSHCHLYVGNEGGPRHFAEAVGIPTVAICSPSIDRAEWLPGGRPGHLGIEWRDVNPVDPEPEYESGDSTYYQLYNSIKPEHVIAMVDEIVDKIVGPVVSEKDASG